MPRFAKVLPVLVVLSGSLMAAGLALPQKTAPTPVYTWSAVLPSEADLSSSDQNLFGPDGYTFSTGNTAEYVGVSYTAPKKGTPYSQFVLRVSAPSDLVTMPWIGYRGVVHLTYTGIPNCNFPDFDEYGYLIPDSHVSKVWGCLTGFLNHKHPQAPYFSTQITLRVPNIDYSTIPVGGTPTFPTAKMDIFVTDETGSGYSRVGYDPDTYSAGTVTIERKGTDEWTTTTSLPVVLTEVYYTTSDGKRPTTLTIIPQTVTTEPVNTRIVWTRASQ